MSNTEVSIDMIADHIRQTLSRLEKVFRRELWLISHIVVTTASGSTYGVRLKSGDDEMKEFLYEGDEYLMQPGEFIYYDGYNNRGTTTNGYVGFCPSSKRVLVLDENRQVVTRTSSVITFREAY